jgi:hypothetical protein
VAPPAQPFTQDVPSKQRPVPQSHAFTAWLFDGEQLHAPTAHRLGKSPVDVQHCIAVTVPPVATQLSAGPASGPPPSAHAVCEHPQDPDGQQVHWYSAHTPLSG